MMSEERAPNFQVARGGAVNGGGTIWESGQQRTGKYYNGIDAITGWGDLQPSGGTGSGSESGSTSWSYSGSGSYTDANATSGIQFFIPGGAQPSLTSDVTGTALASGSITATVGGGWTDSDVGSGSWTESGSASAGTTASNDASYSGSGNFTATGAVTGGGTIWESGNQSTGSRYTDIDSISGSGSLQPGSGTGSGSESGSTAWSYSGSGSYTDAAAAANIPAFPSPVSGTPVNSGAIVGTAFTSGGTSTTSQDQWSASEDSSGNWSYSGSGSTTADDSTSMSYAGSGSFTQSISDGKGGNVSVSGTMSESGSSQTTVDYQKSYQMTSSGGWVLDEGSGSGDLDWCTGWSYAGSGSYSYPDPAGSGTITGTTSASGGDPVDPLDQIRDSTGGNAPGLPPPTAPSTPALSWEQGQVVVRILRQSVRPGSQEEYQLLLQRRAQGDSVSAPVAQYRNLLAQRFAAHEAALAEASRRQQLVNDMARALRDRPPTQDELVRQFLANPGYYTQLARTPQFNAAEQASRDAMRTFVTVASFAPGGQTLVLVQALIDAAEGNSGEAVTQLAMMGIVRIPGGWRNLRNGCTLLSRARTAVRAASSAGRVGPQFNPQQLEQILQNLELRGVSINTGADAVRYLDRARVNAAYVFEQGRPGILFLRPDATRLEVLEELVHHGQAVRAGFQIPANISAELFAAQRELAAQDALLRIARRLNWTQEEITAINQARQHYSQLVQDLSR